MNINEIVSGWITFLSPIKQEEVREISESRLKECIGCEFNSTVGEIKGLKSVCKECSCPLIPKSFSKESECPLGRW